MSHPPPRCTLFPYTTLFRSCNCRDKGDLSHEMAFGRQTLRERGLHEKTSGQTKCSPTQRLALNTGGSLSFVRSFCLKDRKSTRLNSSHRTISYAVFCLKKNM